MEHLNDDESFQLIQVILDEIKSNNNQDLSHLLSLLPLNNLSVDKSNVLLNQFLEQCIQYKSTQCVKPILDIWNKEVYSDIEEIPLYVLLYFDIMFDVEILKFLSTVLNDYTYLQVMHYISSYDSVPTTPQACSRAIEVFGTQDIDIYTMVRDESESLGNMVVYNLMDSLISELTTEYAVVPPWVKNFHAPNPVPYSEQITISEPTNQTLSISDEQAIKLLIDGIRSQNITIDNMDDAIDKLHLLWGSLSQEDKQKLLEPYLEKEQLLNLQNDIMIFRILGPANTIMFPSLDDLQNGGYRMFLNGIFDYDEETGELNDWFVGSCQQCNLKIRVKWHAVRMPRPGGGWVGCFCSMKCVREEINRYEQFYGEPEIMTRLITDKVEGYLLKYRIQDRIN